MAYFQKIEGSPQNSVISQIVARSFTFTADCPATYKLLMTQVIGNDSPVMQTSSKLTLYYATNLYQQQVAVNIILSLAK